ncbi:MAG: hypothetical protein AAF628_19690 [Planctomycetota bacterium]
MRLPALGAFTTHLFSDGVDGPQNLWNQWWMRRSILQLHSPWVTDQLFFPHGIDLAGATLAPFNGLLSLPLCAVMNPVAAFNTIAAFSFVATGWATFLLARELTGRFWPSALAGAVFTFCPYHFAHAQGHMNLVALQGLPLFLWALLRLLRRPSHRRALLAAAALFVVVLCDYYSTLYAVLLGAMMLGAAAAARRRSGLRHRPLRDTVAPLLTLALSATLLCGPILARLVMAMRLDPLVGGHDPQIWRNDLLAAVIPGQGWWLYPWTESYWARHPAAGSWSETSSHVGIAVLVANALALRLAWQRGTARVPVFLAGVAVLFYACSLGHEILLLGASTSDVPMPYDLLETIIPALRLSGMPIRLTVVTALATALLVAFAASWGPRWRRLWPLWVALYAVEVWPRPQLLYRPRITPVIEALADLPAGAVTGFASAEPVALYYQTLIDKPITGGYVARWPTSRREIAREIDALRRRGDYEALLDRTEATYLLRDRASMPAASERLQVVAADADFVLYAQPSAALPTADIDRGALDAPFAELAPIAPGEAEPVDGITIALRSTADRGCRYCCAFSGDTGPPVQLFFSRQLELVPDDLFVLSMDPANPVFHGSWGTLDAQGQAAVRVDREPLGDLAHLWCSLIVFEPGTTAEVRRIYRPLRLRLP